MIQRFIATLRSYTRSFWVANVSELFERVAFYAMTPMLVVYLTEARGFESGTAIAIGGYFGLTTYGLAALSGPLADALGYRRAIMLAYALLTAGYTLAGQAVGTSAVLGGLLLVAVGASLIKPIVTGTVQKSCGETTRPVGFSIYYMLVNIGGFLGPNLSGQVRGSFGVERIFVASAIAAAVALALAFVFYREPEGEAAPRASLREVGGNFRRILGDARLMALFLFVAGWWSLFFQFFNVLPLYLRDDLKVSPTLLGLIPSLDAGAIIFLQVLVGYLVRNLAPFRAILIAMLVSAAGVALMGVAPSWILAAAGVVVFAVGEMTYSAHFYNYLGTIARPGQVGMYMGFAFLPIAIGSLISGQIGGPVVAYFREELHAPQLMWFAFAGVGLVSALGLVLLSRWRVPEREAVGAP